MATIDDLKTLGYTVGVAHGSVGVEEDALAAAQAEAAPDAIFDKAAIVTQETLNDLDSAGQLPTAPAARRELASQIAERALDIVQTHADEKVEFHQRALAIAHEMPDVWVVQHTVETESGDTLCAQVYVACKADGTGWDDDAQALLDALADKTAFAERTFQVENAQAVAAAQALSAGGADVTREPGEVTFTVDGKQLDVEAVVALADQGNR